MNHPTSIYFNGVRRGAHSPCVCHFYFPQAHPPPHGSQRDHPIWHSDPLIALYQNPFKKHNEVRREERGEIKIKYIISNFRFHKSRKKDLYLQSQYFEELMETQFTESHEKRKEVRLRPLLNQMIISILWSSVTLLLFPILWMLIEDLLEYGRLPDDGSFGYGFGYLLIFTFMCFLPLNTFILMALHWGRIVQFIIYSKALVIIETIIFLIILYIFENLDVNLHYRVGVIQCLLLTTYSVILLSLIIRLIFDSQYIKFRNHYQVLYDQTHPLDRFAVNKEVDIFLISALLIGAAISIGFILSY